jgi:hypothetical protein
MNKLFKAVPVMMILAATGCASTSQLDEVRTIAEEAKASAAAANTAAAAAQGTADQALMAAKAAQASADEANEKIDRSFKKAMEK